MKKLIYFNSWGADYNKMLHLCIDSLQKQIDETYHIAVISDDFEREYVEVIIRKTEDGKRHPDNGRNMIHKTVDIYQYDFAYYFDHDMIFHRHLNNLKTNPDKVVLSRASFTKMDSHYIQLTPQEVAGRENERAINNGLHIAPKKLFNKFFEVYQNSVDEYRREGINAQQALNKMHVNGLFDFDFVDENHIYWPSDKEHSTFTDQTVLTHFAGQSMENRLKLMSQC